MHLAGKHCGQESGMRTILWVGITETQFSWETRDYLVQLQIIASSPASRYSLDLLTNSVLTLGEALELGYLEVNFSDLETRHHFTKHFHRYPSQFYMEFLLFTF